ncbi:hypothetical protein LSAT2_028011 [Lamellibrachia satsuma]|nr:hypothetical protein LSAT2_028011 [Lamellibrachia satsuma]
MEDKYNLPPTSIQSFDDWIKSDAGSAYGSLGDVGSMDSGHASYHRHHAQPHLNVLLASEDRSHKYVLAYGDDPDIDLPTPDYDDDDPVSYPDDPNQLPPPPRSSPPRQSSPSPHLPPPPHDDLPPPGDLGLEGLRVDQLSSCSETFPSKYVCENPELIEPKKLVNPCLQSKDHNNLHRELKWNATKGIDVLHQKSELNQEFSRRRDTKRVKEMEDKKRNTRTSFEMKLEEQANKLRLHEQPPAPTEIVEEEREEPEFQRVYSKISRSRPAYCT